MSRLGVAALLVVLFSLLGAMSGSDGAALAPGSSTASAADFWQRAKQESYKSVEELLAQNAWERRKGLYFDKLVQGSPRDRTVALTFDDGPHPAFTSRLLAILKAYDVKATFFVVGEMAEKCPELIRAEVAGGHVIANHTYHHVNLTKIPLPQIAAEWQANQDVLKAITGETAAFCRPPGGDYDRDVIRAATAVGLITVLWTDDPGDYARPGESIIRGRVLRRIGNGGIILLHDGVQQTLDVLPQIIRNLKDRGYRFVTIPEMWAQLHRRQVRPLNVSWTGNRPPATPRLLGLYHR